MKRMLVVLAMLPLAAMSQTGSQGVPFNGVIVDVNNNPVKHARIYVKDVNRYAQSDRQGRFGLTDVNPTDTLHVKYRNELYDIPVDGLKSIRIRLADQSQYSATGDESLVSIGYDYVKTRERFTAGSTITGDDLVKTGRFDLVEALQGLVPGLRITRGEFGEGAQANIRASASLSGPTEALYVVDGVIVESLFGIDVHTVDHVEILKDANIYGAQGGNGAIVVYTRRGSNK
ncbi:MAG: TonB-dependent receptor plug domain-containing protein [Salinivirgaceae bacterium]|nr:TonB-dependent receptor plug domain-containing protein [Salinivirgaceae bacterium]